MNDFPKEENSPIHDIYITIKDIIRIDNGNQCSIKILISQNHNEDIREFIIFSSQNDLLALSCTDISFEKFAEIEYAAKVCEAAKRGASILSYSRNSMHMLKQKLCRKGFEHEIADEAVSYLSEKGYINEIADVEQEMRNSINKLWGKRRIVSHLYSKGYGSEAIKTAEELMEDINFEQICFKLLKKRYKTPPETPNEKDKVMAYLMRSGHDSFDIRQALSSFSTNQE